MPDLWELWVDEEAWERLKRLESGDTEGGSRGYLKHKTEEREKQDDFLRLIDSYKWFSLKTKRIDFDYFKKVT